MSSTHVPPSAELAAELSGQLQRIDGRDTYTAYIYVDEHNDFVGLLIPQRAKLYTAFRATPYKAKGHPRYHIGTVQVHFGAKLEGREQYHIYSGKKAFVIGIYAGSPFLPSATAEADGKINGVDIGGDGEWSDLFYRGGL